MRITTQVLFFLWQNKLALENENDTGMDTLPQGSGIVGPSVNPTLSQNRGGNSHAPWQGTSQPLNKPTKTPKKGPHVTSSRGSRKGGDPGWAIQYYNQGMCPRTTNPVYHQGVGGRNGYNIPTQNRFFLLSDLETPGGFGPGGVGYGYGAPIRNTPPYNLGNYEQKCSQYRSD